MSTKKKSAVAKGPVVVVTRYTVTNPVGWPTLAPQNYNGESFDSSDPQCEIAVSQGLLVRAAAGVPLSELRPLKTYTVLTPGGWPQPHEGNPQFHDGDVFESNDPACDRGVLQKLLSVEIECPDPSAHPCPDPSVHGDITPSPDDTPQIAAQKKAAAAKRAAHAKKLATAPKSTAAQKRADAKVPAAKAKK